VQLLPHSASHAAMMRLPAISIFESWPIRSGALLPFGGYKGFGLALMVQALGVLAESGLKHESDYGYLPKRQRSGMTKCDCPDNDRVSRASSRV
jgi:hypothetical protein